MKNYIILIDALPMAANLRTIDTGQYIIANQRHAINHGFTNLSEATGITHSELFYHRYKKLSELQGSLLLEAQHKKLIEKLNASVDHAQESLSSPICTLFPTGFIHSGILKKMPVSYTGTPTAVLTFFHDKTHKLDLLILYKLYTKHYPIRLAIINYLKYLNIRHYFSTLPSNKELIILLLMRNNSISKYVARILKISYRTVEEYKTRLRHKLIHVTLDSLLVLLRKPQKNLLHIDDNEGETGKIITP